MSCAFLQVQLQLFCTGANYCDFIVYTSVGIHTERIYVNTKFLESNIVKVKDFFEKGILPEHSENGSPVLFSKHQFV